MHHPMENLLPSLQMRLDPPLLWASVAQSSEQAPFTSEIVGSILATVGSHKWVRFTCVKRVSQRSTESRRFSPVSSHREC